MPVRTAKAILDQYWNRQIPVDPAQIAQQAGAQVLADYSMPSKGLSGSFDIEHGQPVISFNPNDAWVRQRFTIAHELGHMTLGHGPGLRDSNWSFSGSVQDWKEREANAFSAELLMPSEVMEWFVVQRGERDIGRMSRELGVSEAAMRFRLKNLGYTRS
ncbi:ImmA/IrrE family metallo-endopeptidase [Stutzerimonas nitrititolerans]|uniref:ImmA/IrrE family metallo-endopeptidase n=1 Tax=Stutzerimonas nitrititolerans TaxID=2482751 RepID=UPI001BDBFE70|nr:ImmA/IrrE family metallo-endopeptidase [Stutzerimonas nitrititolerans]MBT1120754.1 ImmA/IrrE family metallo-endopeptidase [Stutzerimonas nitrititolerans]